jgi:low affinity Fe/Cu permease
MSQVRRIAALVPDVVGHPAAFATAVLVVAAWLVWGIAAGFSDYVLLVPSAIASIVTFVIAFSLQYTQNRDTRAIQLKLDEILRTSERARSELVKLERLSDEELGQIEEEIVQLRDEEPRDPS